MRFWQEGLLLLAVLWAAQMLGAWVQMRHYRGVMRSIAETWPDGFVGASAARSTFGRGAVAIVVAAPDETVRQVFLMEGRSIFAKFTELPQAAGRSLSALAQEIEGARQARHRALAGAAAQVRAVLARQAARPA